MADIRLWRFKVPVFIKQVLDRFGIECPNSVDIEVDVSPEGEED